MTRLLDDLLDVSRVAGGMVALSEELHDMRSIVDQAHEQARPLVSARGHQITLNLPTTEAMVYGDGTRLIQIVTNLLNNAAMYTPAGGAIVLTLSTRSKQVSQTVRDNGIGIETALLPHVFDLFIQGERSPDRSQGGLGLGLALVKSLVERHGGEVRARSAGLGAGSEFEITLPRADLGDGAVPGTAQREEISPEALDVLVVDDNEDAAQTLALFLAAHGHRVRVAFRAAEAPDMAAEQPPQVLLLDIGLPDVDGHELARRLRSRSGTQKSIFIALTGYGRPEDRVSSQEAGFDHHLTKPVNLADLAALIGSLVVVRPR